MRGQRIISRLSEIVERQRKREDDNPLCRKAFTELETNIITSRITSMARSGRVRSGDRRERRREGERRGGKRRRRRREK